MKKIRSLLIKISIIMIFISVFSIVTFDHNKSIFGFKIVSIINDDMSGVGIDHNDLVLIKEVDPSTVLEGDIITFRSLNEDAYFEILTHQVKRRTVDDADYPGFVTYGVNNEYDDEKLVNYEYIWGKHACTIKSGGIFFRFLKSTLGYICCIFLPFFILIFSFVLYNVEKMRGKVKISKSTSKERMARVKVNNVKGYEEKRSKNVIPKVKKLKK